MNILFEDNHLIAVYKPPNIPTQDDSSGDKSLFVMVKEYIKVQYNKPGKVFLGLLHRLDRPTHGIVIFAKTSKAAKRMSEQFRNGTIQKEYLATVHGLLKTKSGTLTHYLQKNSTTNTVTAYDKPNVNRKKALLEYEVIQTDPSNNTTHLRINLKTGRSHQIRCQFAKIGYPILGDKKYGPDTQGTRNLALCAHKLSFLHPVSTEQITVLCKNQE